jgi:hypothetical protein
MISLPHHPARAQSERLSALSERQRALIVRDRAAVRSRLAARRGMRTRAAPVVAQLLGRNPKDGGYEVGLDVALKEPPDQIRVRPRILVQGSGGVDGSCAP